jgi:CBS domain containing-hemolysin-like protein
VDADSLSSSLALAVSLLVYAYLTLVEEALALASKSNGSPWVRLRPSRRLRFLRLATILGSSFSLVTLLNAIGNVPVVSIALSALMLLLFIWLLQNASFIAVRRWTNVVFLLTSPACRLLNKPLRLPNGEVSEEWQGNNSHGEQPPGADNETFLTEEQKAVLDDREQRMIRSILALEDDPVREIMRPRVDVAAVDKDTSVLDTAQLMLQSGHSRLPVYEDSIDKVVGIVHARDVLRFMGQEPPYPALADVMRPPFFIPESKRLDELLQEFQSTRFQMAIVVDEYGGTEGIVTMEDLLEEIVGEIEDEFSHEEPTITLSEDGEAIVDARAPLDDLNELLGSRLAMEGIDTVGGYVSGTLGRMARIGDIIDADGMRIEVVAAVGRRLRRLRITQAGAPEAGDTEE